MDPLTALPQDIFLSYTDPWLTELTRLTKVSHKAAVSLAPHVAKQIRSLPEYAARMTSQESLAPMLLCLLELLLESNPETAYPLLETLIQRKFLNHETEQLPSLWIRCAAAAIDEGDARLKAWLKAKEIGIRLELVEPELVEGFLNPRSSKLSISLVYDCINSHIRGGAGEKRFLTSMMLPELKSLRGKRTFIDLFHTIANQGEFHVLRDYWREAANKYLEFRTWPAILHLHRALTSPSPPWSAKVSRSLIARLDGIVNRNASPHVQSFVCLLIDQRVKQLFPQKEYVEQLLKWQVPSELLCYPLRGRYLTTVVKELLELNNHDRALEVILESSAPVDTIMPLLEGIIAILGEESRASIWRRILNSDRHAAVCLELLKGSPSLSEILWQDTLKAVFATNDSVMIEQISDLLEAQHECFTNLSLLAEQWINLVIALGKTRSYRLNAMLDQGPNEVAGGLFANPETARSHQARFFRELIGAVLDLASKQDKLAPVLEKVLFLRQQVYTRFLSIAALPQLIAMDLQVGRHLTRGDTRSVNAGCQMILKVLQLAPCMLSAQMPTPWDWKLIMTRLSEPEPPAQRLGSLTPESFETLHKYYSERVNDGTIAASLSVLISTPYSPDLISPEDLQELLESPLSKLLTVSECSKLWNRCLTSALQQEDDPDRFLELIQLLASKMKEILEHCCEGTLLPTAVDQGLKSSAQLLEYQQIAYRTLLQSLPASHYRSDQQIAPQDIDKIDFRVFLAGIKHLLEYTPDDISIRKARRIQAGNYLSKTLKRPLETLSPEPFVDVVTTYLDVSCRSQVAFTKREEPLTPAVIWGLADKNKLYRNERDNGMVLYLMANWEMPPQHTYTAHQETIFYSHAISRLVKLQTGQACKIGLRLALNATETPLEAGQWLLLTPLLEPLMQLASNYPITQTLALEEAKVSQYVPETLYLLLNRAFQYLDMPQHRKLHDKILATIHYAWENYSFQTITIEEKAITCSIESWVRPLVTVYAEQLSNGIKRGLYDDNPRDLFTNLKSALQKFSKACELSIPIMTLPIYLLTVASQRFSNYQNLKSDRSEITNEWIRLMGNVDKGAVGLIMKEVKAGNWF